MNSHSQRIDRGDAMNLASSIVSRLDAGSYNTVTDKGVKCLADAVLRMDAALKEQSGPEDVAAITDEEIGEIFDEEFLEKYGDELMHNTTRDVAIATVKRVLKWAQPEAGADDAQWNAERIDNMILLLTADHNSGPNYVRGFELAREYMADRNEAEVLKHSSATSRSEP